MRRFHPANLRAAWWALRTARRTRRVLVTRGLDAALAPGPPPPLPAEAERGVRAVLRRSGESCLVNAIVVQAWEAAHARRRDLVIGITEPEGFRAHAWLEGDPTPTPDDAGLEAPELHVFRGEGSTTAPKQEIGSGEFSGVRGGTPTTFNELLRRPAPDYRTADRGSVERPST